MAVAEPTTCRYLLSSFSQVVTCLVVVSPCTISGTCLGCTCVIIQLCYSFVSPCLTQRLAYFLHQHWHSTFLFCRRHHHRSGLHPLPVAARRAGFTASLHCRTVASTRLRLECGRDVVSVPAPIVWLHPLLCSSCAHSKKSKRPPPLVTKSRRYHPSPLLLSLRSKLIRKDGG